MTDFADLFDPGPGRPWFDSLNEEQQDWLNELAAHIREAGREPAVPWMELHRRFAGRWPDASPKQTGTLKDCVRRLVAG